MAPSTTKAPAPSTDKRWRIVDATMRRNGYQPNGLIEALHSVQEAFGYLDQDALRYVSASLQPHPAASTASPPSTATSPSSPRVRHSCVVCCGTACYIKGAKQLLATIEQQLELRPGQTTADGQVSLLTARCLGSCSLAPAAVFDGEVAGMLTPDDVLTRVARWTHDGKTTGTIDSR